MAIIRAFNELDGFDAISSDTYVTSTTRSTVALAGLCRAGVMMRTGGYGDIQLAPMSEGYVHTRVGLSPNGLNNSDPGYIVALRSSTSALLGGFYLVTGGTSSHTLYARLPSDGTGLGTPLSVSGGIDVDIAWKIHPTEGYVRFYVDKVLLREFVGDTSFVANVGLVRIAGAGYQNTTNNAYYQSFSQVIVSDKSTIGGRVHTIPLLDEAASNAWTGVVEDINGIDISPDTTMQATEADQTAMFTHEVLAALPEGMDINALVMSALTRYADDSDVPRLQAVVRQGGVTTEWAITDPVLGGSPTSKNVSVVMETNPATGAAWTLEDVNATELGFRAKTLA